MQCFLLFANSVRPFAHRSGIDRRGCFSSRLRIVRHEIQTFAILISDYTVCRIVPLFHGPLKSAGRTIEELVYQAWCDEDKGIAQCGLVPDMKGDSKSGRCDEHEDPSRI